MHFSKMLTVCCALLFGAFISSTAFAQGGCLNAADFGSANITDQGPNGQLITINSCSYEEEYSIITGVPAGEDIEFTSSTGGYITVRTDSANGAVVAEGFSPVTVSGASGADLFPHWSVDDACNTASSCITTTVQCTSCATECPDGNIGEACDDGDENTVGDVIGEDCVCEGQPLTGDCLNDTNFGSEDLSGAANALITISTCSYQEEYSIITGVTAGEDIEFAIVEGGYITVRKDSVNGAVVAQGTSPVTVSGASGADLFPHWNTDGACGQAASCVETTVQCLTCGTDCPDGNIGDSCDDGDENTVGDVIGEDCVCAGTPIPANDNCGGATALVCGDSLAGTTEGATPFTNSPSGCGFSATAQLDVWYSFEANGTDDYTVSVAGGPSFDAVLYVYSGACEGLVEVGCADNSFTAGVETVELLAPAAGVYFVQFYDFSGFDTYSVSLNCVENQDCPDGNIGDPCDDGDPLTEGETIQADCSCGGGTVTPPENDNCNGTLTDNVEVDGGAPFVNGYTYNFFTVGDEVTATFELLDEVVGLVGFYQTLNPDFAETGPVFPEPGTQIVSETFSGFSPGDEFKIRIKFSYAGGFSTGDTITYIVGDNCGFTPPEPLELPITFENEAVDYAFENFAGGVSTVIPNPDASGENTSATVAEMVKGPGEVFGGSVLALDDPIDFSENKLFKMKVRSPRTGARVLLKVENAGNPGIFFEKEDTSTVANAWETLEFDFSAINTGNEYSRIVLIWDLGVAGDGSPNFTFQYDDIELVMSDVEIIQVDLPIDFEDSMIDYGLTDFGGTASSIVTDPVDPGNTVVQTIRTAGSQVFAGTTVGQPLGLENPVPFDFDNTGMKARVWSPEAGVIVKLKIEQVGNPGIFVEKDVLTTTSGEWETLEFDFSEPTAGALNLDLDYNLPTIFFNFGADPGTTPEQTYFFDDIDFAPGVGGFTPIELPIDFDTPDVTFGLIDFGGNVSTIIPDPEDAGNNVVQSIRTEGAEFFAGTTVPAGGLTNRIPFEEGETTMSVRVWSPEAGVPVRLKLEATGFPGLVAEKEIATTTSGEWETIVFDFSVDALVPVDVNADYNIVSIFFNFDVDQVNPAPEQTYLWDDIAFGGLPSCSNDSPFGSADISANPSASLITISTCSFEGEYSTITGVPAGEDIEFTMSNGGYITVRTDSVNGAVVAEGFSPLTVSAASGADLFAHWNTDELCGTASDCVVTTVQCTTCPTDCPDGNIGDPCDDGDPLTVGETIQADCSCGGGIAVPANDNCDSAISLACGDSLDGTTEGANPFTNTPSGCGFSTSDQLDVWYSFEANGTDDYTISSDGGTGFDGVLYVYSGTCLDLVEVGCSDNTLGGGVETVELAAPEAGVYYVQVYDFGGSGTFTMSLECATDCADPFPAVDEESITTTFLGTSYLLEWDPVEGQIGCQLQLRFANGQEVDRAFAMGEDAGSKIIPGAFLEFDTDYEWRVRCGCSVDPLVVGPVSSWQPFTTPGSAELASSPNPTDGQSFVTFTVEEEGNTTLEVYDMSGRLVDAIFNGVAQPNNEYRFEFDGSALPNGVYIYRLTTEFEVINDKFMIAK